MGSYLWRLSLKGDLVYINHGHKHNRQQQVGMALTVMTVAVRVAVGMVLVPSKYTSEIQKNIEERAV